MNKLFAAVFVISVGMLFTSTAVGQSTCNPACGQGQSCCVMQYSNGTYSAPYCKTGSCFTSASKRPLQNAKELDATERKEQPDTKAKDAKAKDAKGKDTQPK
jgi:hypothetical protein